MSEKIKMQHMFFNRRQTEMGEFLRRLETYEEEAHGEQDDEKRWAAEDRMQAYFPPSAGEREVWNLIPREGDFVRVIDGWKTTGSAIFAFRDDLLQMFLRSDVQDTPINAIQFPYDGLYLYFGEADLFPGFSDQYRIDGFLLSVDSLCRQFKHGKIDSIETITRFFVDWRKQHQKSYDYWRKQPGPEAEEKAAYWRERLDENVEVLAQKELERQQANHQKHLTLQNDPDSFDYDNDKEYWGSFAHITATATVIPRNGAIHRLSPQEVLDRPYLTAIYDFRKHSTTIAAAIEERIKECSAYTADCFVDDLTWETNGRLVDMHGQPINLESGEWRQETRQDSEGNPQQEYFRLNNPLNVCNRPELLETVTRLVFNALCYLNWKDKDVEERYSDPIFHGEMAAAPNKKQEKLRVKAAQMGYRKLWFCGYNTAHVGPNTGTGGGSVPPHWRRGHWRNQPYGKGLAQTRLSWIRPVIVNKSSDTPEVPTIYR